MRDGQTKEHLVVGAARVAGTREGELYSDMLYFIVHVYIIFCKVTNAAVSPRRIEAKLSESPNYSLIFMDCLFEKLNK